MAAEPNETAQVNVDEFCIIFHHTDIKEAYETAVLIQDQLKKVEFKVG
jgi:PleD family two-component response regulator